MRAVILAALLAGESLAPVQAQTFGVADPMVAAAQSGDAQTALALLRNGGDAKASDPGGVTALIWAAHYGEAELARALLRAGADANARSLLGVTAMDEAAAIGATDVIEALLNAGVDANAANREGQTPLMAVARTGKVDAARLLLDAGADIDAREEWGGQTALMWAVTQRHPDMVRLLVDHGADVNAQAAVRDWQRRMTVEPREKIMARGGLFPLHYAARENCIECARILVEAGAVVDMDDPSRISPLNVAIMNRHFDLARYLIEAGADVGRWDFYGRTPLFNAVDMSTPPARDAAPIPDENSAVDIIALLLELGADPNVQIRHRPKFREGVNERGADVMLSVGATALTRAARAADLEAIRLLIDHGAVVDMPNQYGVTPLMIAAGMGFSERATRGQGVPEARRIAALEMLLDAGADINRRVAYEGRIAPPGMDTFLYRIRIRTGNQRYIHSYVPPEGRIALHGAAMNGWTDMVNWMITRGSDIDAHDIIGLSPMQMASGEYEPEILMPPADPFPETMAALQGACDAQPGCDLTARPLEQPRSQTAALDN